MEGVTYEQIRNVLGSKKKKELRKRHRSKNKGSMGSTPSFDTFCGAAAKLPNLCASDLSLPSAPPPPL